MLPLSMLYLASGAAAAASSSLFPTFSLPDSIPNDLNFVNALDSKFNALQASEKKAVWAQQAKLRAMLPDYDKLDAQWGKKDPIPSGWGAWKGWTWKWGGKRSEVEEESWTEEEEKVEREKFEAKLRARGIQDERPICVPWTEDDPIPPSFVTGGTTCVSSTRSDQIDHPEWGLQAGTINNWADGHVPPAHRGIFYMQGNPLPSVAYSSGRATWNESTGSWEIPAGKPKSWSSMNNTLGHFEQLLERWGAVRYRSWCAQNSLTSENTTLTAKGTICRTEQHITWLDFDFSYLQYWAFQINKDYSIRTSRSRYFKLEDGTPVRYNYNLFRIVDDKGRRTKYWYTEYMNTVGKFWAHNNTQGWNHLEFYQAVPLRPES